MLKSRRLIIIGDAAAISKMVIWPYLVIREIDAGIIPRVSLIQFIEASSRLNRHQGGL